MAGMTGGVVCLTVLVAASAFGLLHRRRSGRIRVRARDDGKRLGEQELGGPLGERATLRAVLQRVLPALPGHPAGARRGGCHGPRGRGTSRSMPRPTWNWCGGSTSSRPPPCWSMDAADRAPRGGPAAPGGCHRRPRRGGLRDPRPGGGDGPSMRAVLTMAPCVVTLTYAARTPSVRPRDVDLGRNSSARCPER